MSRKTISLVGRALAVAFLLVAVSLATTGCAAPGYQSISGPGAGSNPGMC